MDRYDVFLNHRGPDVKGGFVAHLHEALGCVGINAFLDKKSLVQGHRAFDCIDEALENARVHVAVVSKGYAESTHCLREVVAMMRSGKAVIPVFYDVEPAHLRRVENGPFASAFEKHKSREAAEQVEEWADALGRLADVSGFCFRLRDYQGDEAELKQRVVGAVKRLVPANVRLLPVERLLVGLEDQVRKCVKKLESISGGTGLLGLVGMGGIGKTCVAKEIFNHFVGEKKFQAMSFLEGDYGSASRLEGSSSLLTLRRQLLRDLLHVSDSSEHSYRDWFSRLSSGGRVLIMLDDFHDEKQFEGLILDARLLPPGSCIIVTSRDRHFLRVVGRGADFYLHEVTTLGCGDSLKLFNEHAFGDERGLEKFRCLAEDVSKGCGGLPLALKVVGRSLSDKLCDEDEALWVEAIDTLGKNPKVVNALTWSYNCLSEAEKLMFLDIAGFLYGRNKKEALEIWKSCKKCSSCCGCRSPETSLRRLIDKCLVQLVDLNGEDTLGMHNLIQELGKDIGCGDGTHLWEGKAVKALLDKSQVQGTKQVRALNLAHSRKRNFKAEDFAKMTKLHYLVLDGCIVSGDFGSSLEELRWLQWREMPLMHPPPMLDLFNLTSLDFCYSSDLAALWTESSPGLEACPNLQTLNLKGCTSITMLPDSMRHLSGLQVLELGGCWNLEELPSSIGQLTSLQDLNVNNCRSLRGLPDSITTLSGLQVLFMCGCSSMSNLPMEMRLMRGLTHLETDIAVEWKAAALGHFNPQLKQLVIIECTDESRAALDSSGALRNLAQVSTFDMYECTSLTKAPETIGLLTNLVELGFFNCEKLQELPNSIEQLKVLRELILFECKNLETLPDSLGELRSLDYLRIVQCTSITKLPTSIGQLSCLVELNLQGCSGLQSLPDSLSQLNALKYLIVMDCGSLEGLGWLRVLRGLRIWGCTSVTKLLGSCLLVMVDDHSDWFWYRDREEEDFVRGEVRELRRFETNDCGYLRCVEEVRSGRMMVQRVYKWPCVEDSGESVDISTSDEEGNDKGMGPDDERVQRRLRGHGEVTENGMASKWVSSICRILKVGFSIPWRLWCIVGASTSSHGSCPHLVTTLR